MSIPQSGGGPIESFDQLAALLESGCKPKADWRIGTEHEKFGWLTDSRKPLPYAGDRSIAAMFAGLEARFGWQPVREGEFVIGLTRNGANVSLEPGGQFELSGAPLVSVHETAAELDNHLAEAAEVAGPMGVRFMGIGAPPDWRHEDMPVMPKGRYRLMTDYMGRVGTHGTQMMYRTSTVQVNLDYASEADMVKKLRVALALQPVATALFASSPFFEGKENGHKSWRSRIWRDLDASRTGMLPFAFEDGMGFQRYVDWVLDVPMYFVYRDGKYINALGQSFRAFLNGDLPALPGEKPTLSDWADDMTTVFPEARVKISGGKREGRALLAKDVLGSLHIATGLFEGGFTFHHGSIREAPECLYVSCRNSHKLRCVSFGCGGCGRCFFGYRSWFRCGLSLGFGFWICCGRRSRSRSRGCRSGGGIIFHAKCA